MSSPEDLARAVRENPLWYHTLELPGGLVTPGWFDLRPIVDRIPWPDVRGRRCLDVGTYDGYLAFELEARGAAEVVATDVASHEDWDWLPRQRSLGPDALAAMAGPKGRGFELAAAARGSSVRRELVSAYDLHPDRVGTFDVVVCGSLLLHLRDPFRALEAIRSVCTGQLVSVEQIEVGLSALHRRRPTLRLVGEDGQWLVPNAAAHSAMLTTAGFDLLESSRPFAIPMGSAHPDRDRRDRRDLRAWLAERAVGGRGV
ncbi:MAG TPA: class I SAM-dependent methyltransferase, partial [Acidimicrobiales bacterium]|nr:class I SAM-dependent methyltransferase [Acidimicrobiales bacterium]